MCDRFIQIFKNFDWLINYFYSPLKVIKTAKKHTKSPRKFSRVNLTSPTEWILERKFCFNEMKLKNFMAKYNIPINIKNIMSIKEHAAEKYDEKFVDLTPALSTIVSTLPKEVKGDVSQRLMRHITKTKGYFFITNIF